MRDDRSIQPAVCHENHWFVYGASVAFIQEFKQTACIHLDLIALKSANKLTCS